MAGRTAAAAAAVVLDAALASVASATALASAAAILRRTMSAAVLARAAVASSTGGAIAEMGAIGAAVGVGEAVTTAGDMAAGAAGAAGGSIGGEGSAVADGSREGASVGAGASSSTNTARGATRYVPSAPAMLTYARVQSAGCARLESITRTHANPSGAWPTAADARSPLPLKTTTASCEVAAAAPELGLVLPPLPLLPPPSPGLGAVDATRRHMTHGCVCGSSQLGDAHPSMVVQRTFAPPEQNRSARRRRNAPSAATKREIAAPTVPSPIASHLNALASALKAPDAGCLPLGLKIRGLRV